MTLPEVLVVASLGLMALGLAFAYLVPALRASARGSIRVEMEQQALVTFRHMLEDFVSTNVGGVSLAPSMIGIQPLQGVREDGVQVWLRQLVVYTVADGDLLRFLYPPDPDTPGPVDLQLRNIRPTRLSEAVLGSLADVDGPRRVRLATGVKALEVRHGGATEGISQPLSVTLKLERDAATGRKEPERLSLSRTMFLRSQR